MVAFEEELVPLLCLCGFMCPTLSTEQAPPRGYVTFNSSDENPLEGEGLCYRDVTSPINDRDVESSSCSSRGMCRPGGEGPREAQGPWAPTPPVQQGLSAESIHGRTRG